MVGSGRILHSPDLHKAFISWYARAYMAITSSAKKAHRASLKKRVFNTRRAKALRETTKDVLQNVQKKNVPDAEKNLPAAYKAIDKAAKRGIIKKNTASRKKSRLARAIARTAK